MHVPLSPAPCLDGSAKDVYESALREMDGLVGTIRRASDENDKGNTLIWFTGEIYRSAVIKGYVPSLCYTWCLIAYLTL